MQHLILRPGPQLVMREFRPEPDDFDARPNEVDVTDRAHEFLFELITLHADLFSDLDQPGCDALFDDLGGRSPREIGRAVRDIEDSENAAEWLLRVFDGTVVVKAPFRDRTGREFRRAFGDARRADKT